MLEAKPIFLQLPQGGYFRQLILCNFDLLGHRCGSRVGWDGDCYEADLAVAQLLRYTLIRRQGVQTRQ